MSFQLTSSRLLTIQRQNIWNNNILRKYYLKSMSVSVSVLEEFGGEEVNMGSG
jgi:hypothetical protein